MYLLWAFLLLVVVDQMLRIVVEGSLKQPIAIVVVEWLIGLHIEDSG